MLAHMHFAEAVKLLHASVVRRESGPAWPSQGNRQIQSPRHDRVVAIGADYEGSVQLLPAAVDRRGDANDLPVFLNHLAHMRAFADGDPGSLRTFEQEVIEGEAREPKCG